MRCYQDDSGIDLGFSAASGLEGVLDDVHECWVSKDKVGTGVGVLVRQLVGGVATVGERGTETGGSDAMQEDGPDDVVRGEYEDGRWGGGMCWVRERCGEVVEGMCELEGIGTDCGAGEDCPGSRVNESGRCSRKAADEAWGIWCCPQEMGEDGSAKQRHLGVR